MVTWCAKKCLPFNFFDDCEESKNVFEYLNTQVELPKRNKLKSLFQSHFEKTQKIILEILQKNSLKISDTIDGWTSIRARSYYGITAHFIDENWVPRSLVIDFVPSNGKHTGKDIANLFLGVIKEKGLISKLQGITVDNASANTSFIDKLASLLSASLGTEFDSNDLHFRCFAHIIHLAAQDFLRELQIEDNHVVSEEYDEYDDREELLENHENVYEEQEEEEGTSESKVMVRLRTLFKKLKYSEQLRDKLKSACDVMGVKFLSPILDVSTRWNSSCDMIDVALQMRAALEFFCTTDSKLQLLNLTTTEWDLLNTIRKYLMYFKTLSTTLCGDKYITLPLVILGFNLLLDKLETSIQSINEKRRQTVTDMCLKNALQRALDKLLKHYRKCN